MAELHIFLPTHTQMHFNKPQVGLAMICWRAVMKSNEFLPDWTSIVFALNLDSRDEEIAVIREFYPEGSIVELEGTYIGKEERSYQISTFVMNYREVANILAKYKQTTFMYIGEQRRAKLVSTWSLNTTDIGRITKVLNKRYSCTYCPATKTYWKALL